MLGVFVFLAQLCLTLTHGWDSDKIAPGPTDCVNEPLTFCGVTFFCQCIWEMPTFLEARDGCGVSNAGINEEVHPILIDLNDDETLNRLNMEESLWEEIVEDIDEEESKEEDEEAHEEDTPEDPDTEGCGVPRNFTRNEEVFPMLSLRPATIAGINGSHYLPGNVEAILKIIHKRTGGQCKLLQRSIKKGCERKELKSFQNMNFTEYEGQWDHPFAIRVRLRKNMRRTVVNAVGLGYLDKYGMSENPCKVTPKKREVLCTI